MSSSSASVCFHHVIAYPLILLHRVDLHLLLAQPGVDSRGLVHRNRCEKEGVVCRLGALGVADPSFAQGW